MKRRGSIKLIEETIITDSKTGNLKEKDLIIIYGPVKYFDSTVFFRDITEADKDYITALYKKNNINAVKKILDIYGDQGNRGLSNFYLKIVFSNHYGDAKKFLSPKSLKKGLYFLNLLTRGEIKNEFCSPSLSNSNFGVETFFTVGYHVPDWEENSENLYLRNQKNILEADIEKYLLPSIKQFITEGNLKHDYYNNLSTFISTYLTAKSHSLL